MIRLICLCALILGSRAAGAAQDADAALARILRELKHEDPKVRVKALNDLFNRFPGMHFEDRPLSKEVAPLLEDSHPEVREAAIRMLRHSHDFMDHAARIAGMLKTEREPSVLRQALDSLSRKDCSAHSEAVAALLRHRDPSVRSEAISALAAQGARKDAAVELLKDEVPSVKSAALAALAEFGAREYGKEIAELLRYEYKGDDLMHQFESRYVRIAAARCLAELDLADYLPEIEKLARDQKHGDVEAAARQLRASRDLPRLIESLDDRDPAARAQALPKIRDLISIWTPNLGWVGLAEWKRERAVRYFRRISSLLQDPDSKTRTQAALTLGELNQGEYAPQIALMLGKEAWEERSTAAKVLGKFSYEHSRKHLPNLLRLLRDDSAEVRASAIGTLCRLMGNPPMHVEIGEDELKENYRTKESLEKECVKMLRSDKAVERIGALEAVGWLGTTAEFRKNHIHPLLDDADRGVRIAAVQGLWTEDAPALQALLKDRDARCRRAAIGQLRKIGHLFAAQEIFQSFQPSVVLIEVTAVVRGKQAAGLGSGFIVKEDGLVMTNRHVLEPAPGAKPDSIDVTLSDGRKFSGRIVQIHDDPRPRSDLAALRILDAPADLQPAQFADRCPEIGDTVFVIGHPRNLKWTLGEGKVSQLRGVTGEPGGDRFLQTDAAVNPGNSGGPMFNQRGEVVGIVTLKLREAEGAAFAISVPGIRQFLWPIAWPEAFAFSSVWPGKD